MANFGFMDRSGIIEEPLERGEPGEYATDPDHCRTPNGVQPVDVIEEFGLGFHLGSAVDLLLKAGYTGEEMEMNARRAIWHLERFIINEEYLKEEG